MKDLRINLIDSIQPIDEIQKISTKEYPTSGNKVSRFFFRFSIVLLIAVILFIINTISPDSGILSNLGKLSFWEGMARLAIRHDKILKGELSDRTNILILGMGGAAHEGPYLTDTIILASLKPSTHQLALFSIPRDLYVPISGYGWQKINAANSLGMAKSKDGAALTSQVINDIFEIPIHYWIRLDFSAFEKLIDYLGGIEVEVERNFVDYQYPAPNFRFQTIAFQAGKQVMNGQRALQFVRSRHGTNNEDTDFARMARQQKVILAIKEKIEAENILDQPTKLWSIYKIFEDKITTNLDFAEIIKLAKLIYKIPNEQIQTYVFTAEPEGLLKPEISLNGAYILRPKSGNFKEMAKMIQDIFQEKIAPKTVESSGASAKTINQLAEKQQTKIIILNGTTISGLARRTKTKLEPLNYQILRIGNAPSRNYQNTIIYYPEGLKNESIENLKKELQAETAILPDNLKYLITSETDFLIILGQNMLSLF